MTRQVRSEWRKVFTVRLWWGMLLGAMAFAAFAVIAQIASNAQANGLVPGLDTPQTQQSLFASAASAEIFSLLVGVIIITTEYRHFTSRPTFLTEPRRGRVILAKMAVGLMVGLLYGAACAAITVAIVLPWLGALHVPVRWSANSLGLVLGGALLAVAIYTVLGIGIGVLVRNQIVAVIGSLAYLFILEPLISVVPVIKGVYRFLPGAAASAMTQIGTSRTRPGFDVAYLIAWQGGLVLLTWGLVFAFIGWLLSVRRDVA